MDGNIPIIKIEIEGMRQRIGQAMALHNDDFDTMIQQAVQKAFSFETIQEKIDKAVEFALDEAIKELSGDLTIRRALKSLVLDSVVAVRERQLKKDD